MQMNQIQQQFERAERCIEDAAAACRSARDVPEPLRSSLSDLDRQVHDAEPMIRGAQSDDDVRECIDALEAQCDRAMQACRDGSGVDPQLRDAVKQAHQELSSLKRQLH